MSAPTTAASLWLMEMTIVRVGNGAELSKIRSIRTSDFGHKRAALAPATTTAMAAHLLHRLSLAVLTTRLARSMVSTSTLDDPEAAVKFEVIEPKIEQMETALNIRGLEAMASIAKGHFLREEDLDKLPEMVAQQSATVASFRKIDLFYSPWWAAVLLIILFAEWLLRRLKQLK